MFENIDVTGIIITAIIIVCGATIAIVAIITEYSRKKLEHELKMAAIQKGVSIPPTPEKAPSPYRTPYRTLKAGLVWTAIGIGFFLAFAVTDMEPKPKIALFGFIAFFVGIALIIAWAVEKKGLKKTE
jgi:hypothetical protein